MKYDVRWARVAKRFVFKDEHGNEAPTTELYGYSRMVGADNSNLHLLMEGMLEVDSNEVGHIDTDNKEVEIPEDAEYLGRCKWRICARRNENDFRFRDEAKNQRIWFTPQFEGVAHWHWDDHKGHLFHEGAGYLLSNGNILLVP